MQKLFIWVGKPMLASIVIGAAILLGACEKQPGKGGSATIKGLIMVQEYNGDFTIKTGEPYPAQDVEVYLVYGDDEIYGDKFQTGFNGRFEFNYLQTGQYMVYVLSKSDENLVTKERVPVKKQVTITEKKQVIDVGTIEIID